MATTQYIGSRYVPVFADPAEWSSTKQYEPLTIVLYQGNSFTSKQFVPVGVDINDTNYWAETGNYNAQVEQYRQETLSFANSIVEKAFAFDTVAEMQESTQLYMGAICHTNGYRANGDGGAAWYTIGTETANGIDQLQCGDFTASLVIYEPNLRQFGAYGDGTNDDSRFIKRAIEVMCAGLFGALYIPSGVYNVIANNVFVPENPYILGGLHFIGDNNRATEIRLITQNTEKWFYNNESIAQSKTQRLTFDFIKFSSDNHSFGNGFKLVSAGFEKQWTFNDCNFEDLSNVFTAEGTGNADLNRFINCGFSNIYDSVIYLNNSQSVDTELVNPKMGPIYGDICKVVKGGCFNIIGGSIDTRNGCKVFDFLDNNIVSIGNSTFNVYGTRFQIEGVDTRLVYSPENNNGVQLVNFFGCALTAVAPNPEKFVSIGRGTNVCFYACQLGNDYLYEIKGNKSGYTPGLILFDSCNMGSIAFDVDGKFIPSGNCYRYIMRNCYGSGGSAGQGTRYNDVDYGWDTFNLNSVAATQKIIPVKSVGTVFNVNTPIVIDLPSFASVQSLTIDMPNLGGSSNPYEFVITVGDGTWTFNNTYDAAKTTRFEINEKGPVTISSPTAGFSIPTNLTFGYIEYV